VAGVLCFAAAAAPAVSAQTPAEFYAGRTVELVIGYTVGAAYDSSGRVIARHWGKHIPGKPSFVVRNMPGAGSLVSANHMYNIAAKDGSVIGLFSRGNAMYPLLEGGAKFDALKFNWIGSPSTETSLVISWGPTPFKTFKDIQRNEMLVGATGAGADTIVMAQVLNMSAGTKLKPVSGYPGNSEALLAMERGEVQGSASVSLGNIRAARPQWLTGGLINPLAQLALAPHPKDVKGVPLALEFATSPVDRQVLELVLSRQQMAYPLVAPPDTPADRVAVLRAALLAMAKDPEYIADAMKAGFDVDAVSGQEIEALIKRIYASPKEAVDRARAAVATKGKK
jgi:tripartite-type tricarboxylate transporter receptor subunit TctC